MSALGRRLYDAIRLNLAIFPGVTRARSADLLAPYYTWRRSRQGPLATLGNFAVYLGFQAWLPLRAHRMMRFWKKDDAWRRQALRWGRKHFVDPGDIAAFEIETENDLRHYVRRLEQIQLIRATESAETDHAPTMVDKAQFQRHCEAHGLPVPREYARIAGGEIQWGADWSAGDRVLVKPVRGSGGIGVFAFEPRSRAELEERLKDLEPGEWLAQEALRVHPALSRIALDALSTARIVTMLDEHGTPEIVSASIRFAVTPGIAVDNNHAGGLSALIDMETGALGKPMEIEGPGRYDRHPTNGERVEGLIVPDWEAAKALAIKSHARAYADHVLIGWDIGFSDRGPVLIEANQRPNVRLTQRIEGKGIGQMRYGELLAFHLARAMAAAETRRRTMLFKP